MIHLFWVLLAGSLGHSLFGCANSRRSTLSSAPPRRHTFSALRSSVCAETAWLASQRVRLYVSFPAGSIVLPNSGSTSPRLSAFWDGLTRNSRAMLENPEILD